MKKLLWIFTVVATTLWAVPATGTTQPQGAIQAKCKMMQMNGCKCNSNMNKQRYQANCNCRMGQNCNCQGNCNCGAMNKQNKRACKSKVCNTQKYKGMKNSPFLIKKGLPHLNRMIVRYWEDPAFALSVDQRDALRAIRGETMKHINQLRSQITPLRQMIIMGTLGGKSSAELKEKVEKLSQLEAEATMVHIQCIYETKKILTKDQLVFLLQKSMQKSKKKRFKRNR